MYTIIVTYMYNVHVLYFIQNENEFHVMKIINGTYFFTYFGKMIYCVLQ